MTDTCQLENSRHINKSKNHPPLSGPVRVAEFLVWCLLAIAVVSFRVYSCGGPEFGNDSYSYLSVAENFHQGNPASTSIITFDTERSHGKIPAPMTTFPPAYPALIALFSTVGLPEDVSGMLVSITAFLGILVLFFKLGNRLGLEKNLMRLAFMCLLANSEFGKYSIAVLSESLFSMSTMFAIYWFSIGISRDDAGRYHSKFLILSNIMIGIAYWIRYAGLFLFAAEIIYLTILMWRRRDRATFRASMWLVVSSVIVGLCMLRNHVLVGTWKGGNNKVVSNALSKVVFQVLRSIYKLVAGDGHTPEHYLTWIGVVVINVAFLGSLIYLVKWTVRAMRFGQQERAGFQSQLFVFTFVYLFTYSAALIYLGHTSVISSGLRMYVPIFPPILIVITLACSYIKDHLDVNLHGVYKKVLIAFSGAYLGLNLYAVTSRPRGERPREIERTILAEEVAPGQTLAAWVLQNVPANAVLVTNRGATGYLLRHPAVSLVLRRFSKQGWDEKSVKATMAVYHAEYIILYGTPDRLLEESKFLSDLLAGISPAWLHFEAGCQDAKVYKLVTPAGSTPGHL